MYNCTIWPLVVTIWQTRELCMLPSKLLLLVASVDTVTPPQEQTDPPLVHSGSPAGNLASLVCGNSFIPF